MANDDTPTRSASSSLSGRHCRRLSAGASFATSIFSTRPSGIRPSLSFLRPVQVACISV
jgi:hypothetical protein